MRISATGAKSTAIVFTDMVLLQFTVCEIQFGTTLGVKYVFASEGGRSIWLLFADALLHFSSATKTKQNFQNIALTPKGTRGSGGRLHCNSINCVSGSTIDRV